MIEKLKNKLLKAFIFLFSLFLLLGMLYVFLAHLDYFTTKVLTTSTSLHFKPEVRDGKIGALINFTFQNRYENKLVGKEIFIERDFYNEIREQKTINIFYTRYFNQILIKGYKNPRFLIILLDIVVIGICCFGIKAGLDTKYNPSTGKIE